MELLPGLQEAFSSFATMGAPPDGLSTAERRAWIHVRIDETFTAMYEERPPVASEIDHRIAVDGGEITARVYRPDADGLLPCYLHLHGGGFWLGTLEQSESSCRAIATDAECVVVDLDYRLAPEHRWPVAAEDSYAALLWIADHAGDLGVDVSRLAVGGGSAGGNLAAVVALMARDRGGPPLVLQVLEVGVFDLERHIGQETIDFYLGDPARRAEPLRVSPAGTRPARSPTRGRDQRRVRRPRRRGRRVLRRTAPGRSSRRGEVLEGPVPRVDGAGQADPRRSSRLPRDDRRGAATRVRLRLNLRTPPASQFLGGQAGRLS